MESALIRNISLLSWVAGTFEGEGTVTITRSGARGYTRAMVMLTSTDAEMVQVFHKRWPGRISQRQLGGNAKLAYTWSLNVRPAIARFLSDIAPFLKTQRVQRKAELVLEDIGARIQGAKGADYLAECHARREEIRILNRRGAGGQMLALMPPSKLQ